MQASLIKILMAKVMKILTMKVMAGTYADEGDSDITYNKATDSVDKLIITYEIKTLLLLLKMLLSY